MKKTRNIILITAFSSLLLILGLILFGTKSNLNKPNANHKLKVIATTEIYSSIAQEILGDAGKASAIIDNPQIDPHDFKPTNKTTNKVKDADLIISNGLGYDDWINPLVKEQKWLNVGRDTVKLKSGDNPHIWFDYYVIVKYSEQLAEELGKIKPEKEKYFQANAQKYIQKLKSIETKINELKAPSDNNLVDVSEPLFDYALKNLGYKVNNPKFALAIENETDPAIKDAQRVSEDFKDHRVSFFVQNLQVENNTTKTLIKEAQANNIPILKVTEMKPANISYIKWQLNIYDQLANILN